MYDKLFTYPPFNLISLDILLIYVNLTYIWYYEMVEKGAQTLSHLRHSETMFWPYSHDELSILDSISDTQSSSLIKGLWYWERKKTTM